MIDEAARATELSLAIQDVYLRDLNIAGMPWIVRKGPRRSYWLVRGTCERCGETRTIYVDNILSGKTSGCPCYRAYKHGGTKGARYENEAARRLGERYDAMVQRCRNPKNATYRRYGARGIELRFADRAAFIAYCLEALPHRDYLGVQIDRTDNDGHYEPGNLRLVDQATNLRNTRRTKTVEYRGASVVAADLWHLLKNDFPGLQIGPHRCAKLAGDGVDWREIVTRRGRQRRTTQVYEVDEQVIARYHLGPFEALH